MFENVDPPFRYFLLALVFPVFFQEQALQLAWGANDPLWLMALKRIYILLPVAGIIFACWATVACALTIIVRQNRRQYASQLFITWWDLGRAIFTFWSGSFKFVFVLVGSIFNGLRLIVFGFWISIQDLVFMPLRAAKSVGDIATVPGTPWIAVIMTLAWCALEAFVFTFVMTSLVMETLGNITGTELQPQSVQIVLYMMLLAFVVGSYAIVATLEQAVKSNDIKQIALIALVEFTTMVFEVFFLYREFVDALVPWFSQYLGDDFKMGFFSIITIGTIVWAGIRGMTWFLFAAHGTPTIMAIIQRTGLRGGSSSSKKAEHFGFIREGLEKIKDDQEWFQDQGDKIVSAFIMPPLQIVGACVNFATMLISAKHLFQLPFKSYKDMLHAEQLMNRVKD